MWGSVARNSATWAGSITWASAGSPTPSKQLQRAADSAAEQRPHLLWPGCLQELLNLVALHSVFLHRKMAQAALQPFHRECE
jgi:hypothetical protein